MPLPAFLAGLKGLPLIYQLMAAFMAGQLGLSAYEKAGQRGLQRTQLGIEEKALLAQSGTTKQVAKSKQRAAEKSMMELRSVMREQRGMRLAEREIESRKEQNMMDQMMINQLIQAMMQSGQPTFSAGSLTPESEMMRLVRR